MKASSIEVLRELASVLLTRPGVSRVEFLGTKVRAHVGPARFIDFYYNASSGRYSYTVISRERRVMGWDNAPHHPGLATGPHHFHKGLSVRESKMTGDPLEDVDRVLRAAAEK